MRDSHRLPIEAILGSDGAAPDGESIGRSRQDRVVRGLTLGRGPLRVSLIAGCHADEPVGPATLGRLAAFLHALPTTSRLLADITWHIVPHVNPDGELRNARWAEPSVAVRDCRGGLDRGFELEAYLRHVVREAPGDDVEFGFPHHDSDDEARPENLAVAGFLAARGPYALHGSLHGMAFAPGPWFLLEKAWIDRTSALRTDLREQVTAMGYRLFDPDRRGEKGFWRIDRGFSTRPDSRAMRRHFEALGDTGTAARFRPSSMEFVRRLGGDPLTFVSELPLFLTRGADSPPPTDLSGVSALRLELEAARDGNRPLHTVAARLGVSPMPIRDQMRLQLLLLDAALHCVRTANEDAG